VPKQGSRSKLRRRDCLVDPEIAARRHKKHKEDFAIFVPLGGNSQDLELLDLRKSAYI
jgi:hypothetical protein